MPQTWTARLFEISAIESAAQGYNNLLHGAKIPFGKQKFPCQTHVVSDLKALAAPWQLTAGHLTTSIISSSVHSARSWNTSKKFKESMTWCDQYVTMFFSFLPGLSSWQGSLADGIFLWSPWERSQGQHYILLSPRDKRKRVISSAEVSHESETQAAHGLKTEVSHWPWETITNMDIWGSLRQKEKKNERNFQQGRCAFVLWSDWTCRVSLLHCIRKRERTATSKAQGKQGLVYRHTICCSNFLENICNQGIARARAERFGCPPCMCHFRGSCCGMCL